jgi:3'(2'), 5'-bisphosphate nucleotidase/myo-inositol-1(or 4)-monophosphatase
MNLTPRDLFLLSQCAISAACQAGHRIADYSKRAVEVNTKQAGTSLAAQVVTEVDHLSQDIILQILKPLSDWFDLALLSEESPDDQLRLSKAYFWCIDPLDGTLPFIESVPGYSVSIALVSREGLPHIGVVFDPVTQTLYHAIQGQGAWRNHQPLTPSSNPESSPTQQLIFITDKSFRQDPLYAITLNELNHIAVACGYTGATLQLQGGAAMNACHVLNNPLACYFKFPKPQLGGGSIWDYAATSCLFAEAGLPVSDMRGHPLILNPDGSTFMNHCGVLFCANPIVAQQMKRLYQRLESGFVSERNLKVLE